MLKISILDINLKITNLLLQLHLPEAKELTDWPPGDLNKIAYK